MKYSFPRQTIDADFRDTRTSLTSRSLPSPPRPIWNGLRFTGTERTTSPSSTTSMTGFLCGGYGGHGFACFGHRRLSFPASAPVILGQKVHTDDCFSY